MLACVCMYWRGWRAFCTLFNESFANNFVLSIYTKCWGETSMWFLRSNKHAAADLMLRIITYLPCCTSLGKPESVFALKRTDALCVGWQTLKPFVLSLLLVCHLIESSEQCFLLSVYVGVLRGIVHGIVVLTGIQTCCDWSMAEGAMCTHIYSGREGRMNENRSRA